MLKIVKGNLIKMAQDGEFDAIVHGCNCFTTMGSGIARQLRDTYPEVYEVDCETVRGDKSKLGSFSLALPTTERKFAIFNAYTQFGFNSGGANEDVFEYEAFERFLANLVPTVKIYPRFGFPLIGCGLAGGNKERILAMLVEFSVNVVKEGGEATLVEFAP